MSIARNVVRLSITGAALALALAARPGLAQETADLEKNAKQQRQGAGLRVGAWRVDLPEASGVEYAETPAFEGYFQKGLDLHLAIESTVGFWRRSQTAQSSGTLGGSTTDEIDSYVVPLFTALKLYPFTRPEHAFEPYLLAGAGLAVGIDDRNTTSGGLLGGAGNGTAMLTGFGFKGGAGLEWRFSPAFGLNLGGRYQWIRFGSDVGGERTYKGPAFEGGLTYRFQYR